MKKTVMLIIWFCFFFSLTDAGEQRVVYQQGEDLISGSLPESWSVMTTNEVASLINNKSQLFSKEVKTLAGFRLGDAGEEKAMLFIFYSQPGEKISWEQRQKMFNWFKGNTSLMSEILPDNSQGITLENIEYIQEKDTLLFESKVKINDTDINGVNGIIFLRKGYLDIAGYTAEGAREQLNDFYSFIKTLSVSPGLRYTQEETGGINMKWFQDNWQQILGGTIFILVYGVVFLKKDKIRLAGNR